MTLSSKSRWPLTAVLCGVLAVSADSASAQSYCASSLDPMCAAVPGQSRQQAEWHQAPNGSVRPQSPPEVKNPGVTNLPSRIGGELTSPVTDGIARKYPSVGRIGKGASGVKKVLDPAPGDVFCLAMPPGPQRLACEGFVDASWPETISRRQGFDAPEDLERDGRRIRRAQDPCFPSDIMSGEVRGVRGRPCKQSGEFTDDERASVEQANRDGVSYRQRTSEEAERQRRSWNATRENASFLQEIVNRTRGIMNQAGVSPVERAEVERQMYEHLRQLNNYGARGVFPMATPTVAPVQPVPPYRVPPPTLPPFRGSTPDRLPPYSYGEDGPRCVGCGVR